ncbi:MAG: M48 family metallopeptidase [Patescibacteria group bacterium]
MVGKYIAKRHYLKYKEQARFLIEERLNYFNQFYNHEFCRVSIRNQKTRWGSCSSKGNLNFNYRILFLPRDTADYIIVHELCHLKEMNHSKNFWILVSQTFPNYKYIRKNLRGLSFPLQPGLKVLNKD